MKQAQRTGPLDDLTIIDCTMAFAGPFGTVLLADLGANVIKVEPPNGDNFRPVPPFPPDYEHARNHADGLVHSTEKNLKEYGDKIDEADKTAIEAGIQELKDLLASEDPDAEAIKAKTDTLSEQAMKLGEAMYKESQAEAEAAGGEGTSGDEASAGEGSDDADVVDAEFEEVDSEADASKEKSEDEEDKKDG